MNPLEWDSPLPVVIAALFVIVMLRANGTYWLGRGLAAGAAQTRLARRLESPGYQRAHDLLDRWGAPLVTVSFMTIGFQTLVNLAAGSARMSLRRYLPAVSLGCLLWACLYGTVGIAGFNTFVAAYEQYPAITVVVTCCLTLGLAAFIYNRVRTRNAH